MRPLAARLVVLHLTWQMLLELGYRVYYRIPYYDHRKHHCPHPPESKLMLFMLPGISVILMFTAETVRSF